MTVISSLVATGFARENEKDLAMRQVTIRKLSYGSHVIQHKSFLTSDVFVSDSTAPRD